MPRLTKLIGHTEPVPPSLHEDPWGIEEGRLPSVNEGETVLLQEPGRIIRSFRREASIHHNGVDYRSHCFILVKPRYGAYPLIRVRHGGGEKTIQVGPEFERILMPLDSDARYLLMYKIFDIDGKARRETQERTASTYTKAFLQGRLKKVRVPGQKGAYRAEIESVTASDITVVVTLHTAVSSELRTEHWKTIGDSAQRTAIAEGPGFTKEAVISGRIDVKYSDGKYDWHIDGSTLDLETWKKAEANKLQPALVAAIIRSVGSDCLIHQRNGSPLTKQADFIEKILSASVAA